MCIYNQIDYSAFTSNNLTHNPGQHHLDASQADRLPHHHHVTPTTTTNTTVVPNDDERGG